MSRPLPVFQILDAPLDHLALDSACLVRVTDEQAVVAQDIDEARDAVRVGGDALDGGVREQPRVGSAGDVETAPDIAPRLLAREGPDHAAHAEALPELAELRAGERVAQLRLAHEDDLQELPRRRLEVREQSEVLEVRE